MTGRSGRTPGAEPGAVDAWGIVKDWVDADQRVHRVPEATITALRSVLGRPSADLESSAPLVIRPGQAFLGGPGEVLLEDGSRRYVDGVLPADFPHGYHTLRTVQGDRPLIVSPGRCQEPNRRAWGWAVQLYAVRSQQSWGIGDLGDLRCLRKWAQGRGAGFLLVNPLHAGAPTLPQQASPYLPVTRRFRSPLYLRIEDIPGADRADLSDLSRAGRALNAHPLIDRDQVWQLKLTALDRLFEFSARDEAFERWQQEQDTGLAQYAVWCTLAERHGSDWRRWNEALQRPASPAVAQVAVSQQERVTFHTWLQWLLEVQLQRACGDLPVIQDLPIGFDGGGADAWVDQDIVAADARVGAPPDAFNTAGQEWGSPPLNPWRLKAAGYRPFIESVRATLSGAGGLRIDHVLGSFRLWWVPAGTSPGQGAYVRYPAADLLDIVALESARAHAPVVGEDLGTVEPGVRQALTDHGILSYRLLVFETDSPASWPAASMAAVTTHDLPTVAGLWTGEDAADQRRYLPDSDDEVQHGRLELLQRLMRPGDLSASVSVAEAVLGVYRTLARAPSTLLCATLDDAVGARLRPNLPGVTHRPNWCIPLPVPLEELVDHPLAHRLAGLLDDAVRTTDA